MPLNAKYTDADVRASEHLYQLAVRFLKVYVGDFDFLVHARNHLDDHGELPVATARGVLNCMRVDPEGAMQLPQTPTGRYTGDVTHISTRTSQDDGHARRPAYIDLKSTWHVQYVMSTHPSAQVFHVLRPELSHVRWYPHQGQYGYDIEVWCSYPLGWATGSTYIMSNDNHGRRICKGCKRRMEAYA